VGRYLAAVFTDLERHSLAWARTPRDRMLAVIAEYRYAAESLAARYGSIHQNFTGDGHLFLFEGADAAIQFGLRLIETWKRTVAASPALRGLPPMSLRLGSHFGECAQLEGEEAWVGRGINLAKRVEGAAEPDTLCVTESLLDLIDLPLYDFEEAGGHELKGDHLPRRTLYRVAAFDLAALEDRPAEGLTAESWFLKAAALIGTRRENSEEEAGYYRCALQLRADYPEAHNNLAVVLRARGDLEGAAGHYREAIRLRPEYPEAHYNYGILLAARGDAAGATEHFRRALDLRHGYADAHYGYANLLRAHRQLAEAADHYRAALRARPAYAEVHNNLAVLLEDLGEPEAAAGHYEEAIRLRPDYPEAHYNYAFLLENQGNPEGAEQHYREALRRRPDFAEAHNNLAVLLQMRGEPAKAERHYEAALRLRPADPETHYNFGLLLRARGDGDAAREHFRIAYELAPEVAAFRSAALT
jgi:tetratricopeptide (TPR) repeat protein